MQDAENIEMSYRGYEYLVVSNNTENQYTEMLIYEKSNSAEPVILIYVCLNLEQFDEVYSSCESINDDVYSFKKIDNKLFIHDTKLAIIEGYDIYKNSINIFKKYFSKTRHQTQTHHLISKNRSYMRLRVHDADMPLNFIFGFLFCAS